MRKKAMVVSALLLMLLSGCGFIPVIAADSVIVVNPTDAPVRVVYSLGGRYGEILMNPETESRIIVDPLDYGERITI